MGDLDPFRPADYGTPCPKCGEWHYWNAEDLIGDCLACGHPFTGEETTTVADPFGAGGHTPGGAVAPVTDSKRDIIAEVRQALAATLARYEYKECTRCESSFRVVRGEAIPAHTARFRPTFARVACIQHTTDADCAAHLVNDVCAVCGVHHGAACNTCGGRGYHHDGCAEADRG